MLARRELKNFMNRHGRTHGQRGAAETQRDIEDGDDEICRRQSTRLDSTRCRVRRECIGSAQDIQYWFPTRCRSVAIPSVCALERLPLNAGQRGVMA
jgi:hypothetical protein